MKKKLIGFISVLALTTMVLGACGGNDAKKEIKTSEVAKEKIVKVTDGEGKEVEVPKNPKKVVVFDMGSLDTINQLGAGDTVIGAPLKTLPKYLDTFKSVESAGGIKEPDMEKINAMQPELIIISGRQQDAQKDLEKIAPTLYLGVDSTKTWESTKQNIETLGTIFDKEDAAKEKIAKLETDIKELKEKAEASKKTGLVTLVNEGSLSAYGKGSRFGIVHDTFGVAMADDKIEASTHGQEVSYEYVLEKNPDVLFVIDRTKAIGGDDSKNNVAENALVKQTNAGKNGKVITLTPDVWYLSGGGIESTELMIKDVAKGFE
ncbi:MULTISPECIES: siderophore ABC transporter substrate-binding protein [Vagococcus]|uniref:Iron compound ABC uptake transporter substrate-binding protein n=1 Tax=Vagococcus fluvialis bH819 TaxID=1255619 RepID=A0A1X6WMW2_9ENTE|nr:MULTISPECIES: siderophore ABC transporter substrate-binding protein [Vagococcus]SLM85607.1 Iron compound ABC uptake transporter substrate-binding protein [Vagococcus fluvialis bH819]HCM89575.1 iron ABC transporter substrate-binding protein [Vagococcus sp.]